MGGVEKPTLASVSFNQLYRPREIEEVKGPAEKSTIEIKKEVTRAGAIYCAENKLDKTGYLG